MLLIISIVCGLVAGLVFYGAVYDKRGNARNRKQIKNKKRTD